MHPRPSLVALSLACLVASPVRGQEPAGAPGGQASPAPLQFHVFTSLSAQHNFNHPSSRSNQDRVFDFDHDQVTVDVVEMVLQKPAAEAGQMEFRVDLAAGLSIPRVSAASGLFRDRTTGKTGAFDLQQAYVGYVVKVGRGLHLDAGKWVTHMGYELIEGYDGYNDNHTHSFLFGYAIPFTHTGVRVSYAVSDKVSAQLHVVNGWDVAADNNRAKSFGFQLAYTPTAQLSFLLNGMTGPERQDDDHDRRNLLDVVATWKAQSWLSVGLNVDYGHEQNAKGDGRPAAWGGVAGYLRANLSDHLALALRAESFHDRDGARTGVAGTLREVTLTPEWKLVPNVIIRGDLRLDWSERDVFEKRGRLVRHQPTASLDFIFLF